MTGKILVVCLCCAAGTAIGFYMMYSHKRRYVYYNALVAMLVELKQNIAFRRDSVVAVLGAYACESKPLKKNIDEYLAHISNKGGDLALSRGFLTRDAHADVVKLFSRLGGFDGDTQSGDLEMFISRFTVQRDKAKEKFDKYGALCVKLGFLIGLGIGILFL